jgi:hypothetical protein
MSARKIATRRTTRTVPVVSFAQGRLRSRGRLVPPSFNASDFTSTRAFKLSLTALVR